MGPPAGSLPSGGTSPPQGEAAWAFTEKKCSELLEPLSPTFLCPITHELFQDPVFSNDGHTYERSAIERHFANSCRSPLTNEVLSHVQLVPNHHCKAAVAEYKAGIVRSIKDILPAAPDIETIEALVRRGLECASHDVEHRELRAHQECLLAARAKAAEASGRVEDAIAALEALLSACGAEATKDAVASLELDDAAAGVCIYAQMGGEHRAKVIVARERLLRHVDRGLWPRVAAAAVEASAGVSLIRAMEGALALLQPPSVRAQFRRPCTLPPPPPVLPTGLRPGKLLPDVRLMASWPPPTHLPGTASWLAQPPPPPALQPDSFLEQEHLLLDNFSSSSEDWGDP